LAELFFHVPIPPGLKREGVVFGEPEAPEVDEGEAALFASGDLWEKRVMLAFHPDETAGLVDLVRQMWFSVREEVLAAYGIRYAFYGVTLSRSS
jgi:hypothetical protein